MSNDASAALEDVIARYIAHHPHAADSAEGVRKWWLGEDVPYASLRDVEAALERLTRRGLLQRTALADGTLVYRQRSADTPDEKRLN